MNIFEVESGKATQTLMALSQFLLGRANDVDSSRTVSLQTFIGLAEGMGLSLTGQQLKDISLLPPLSNLIDNVEIDPRDSNKGKVYFKGAEVAADQNDDKMSVDQARTVVKQMAKRANKL